MSKQNVKSNPKNPDVHTVRVNMSSDKRERSRGPVHHAAGTVAHGSYNMEYQSSGPGTSKLTTRSDFVYVNSSYVGSVNSVNSVDGVNSVNNINPQRCDPPTSVIREQYWTCSRWPFAQRVLAIAVGLLVGAVISLVIILTLKGHDNDIRSFIETHLAPD